MNDYRNMGVTLNVCKYYHGYQTAAVLSIDDLAFTAILDDGRLLAANDWGYGLDSKNGIWTYLEDTLFNTYPEIRGTIFFPITNHHGNQNVQAGYEVVFCEDENRIYDFLQQVQNRFEIAFHGTEHGHYINVHNPSLAGNWKQEFEYRTLADIPELKQKINTFENKYDIHFSGGKYPGYLGPDPADNIIEELGFHWWMRRSDMIGRSCPENDFSWFGNKQEILDIPTNVESGMFRHRLNERLIKNWKNKLKEKCHWLASIYKVINEYNKEAFINELYEKQLPITIQSHFTNMRTDGYRQAPNIYDDLESLMHIYSLLRGADIWHTSCGNLAEYYTAYSNAVLEQNGEYCFSLGFKNNLCDNQLSVRSQSRTLLSQSEGKVYHGQYHKGWWIFDNIGAGTYVEEN